MASKVFKKSYTLEDLNTQLSTEHNPPLDEAQSIDAAMISDDLPADAQTTQINITDIQILNSDSVGFNLTLNQPAKADIYLELNTSDGIEPKHHQDGAITIDKGSTEYFIEVQTTGEAQLENIDTLYITLSDNHVGQDIQINQSMAILKIDDSDAPSEVPSENFQSNIQDIVEEQPQESVNEAQTNINPTSEEQMDLSEQSLEAEHNFEPELEPEPEVATESETIAQEDIQESSQPDLTTASGAPVVSIQDVEFNESGNATYELQLSHPSSEEIIISFSAQNGSTIVGGSGINGDAILKSVGTLTIEPGQTSANIQLKCSGEHLSDSQTPMDLYLDFISGGEGATIAKQPTNITMDNADASKVGIADIDAIEGSLAMFTISLDKPAESDTHINFSTHHGCTISGGVGVAQEHFEQTNGELIIPAGELYGIIDVQTASNQDSSVHDGLVISLDGIDSEHNAIIDSQNASATLTDINQYNSFEHNASNTSSDSLPNVDDANETLAQDPVPLQQAATEQQDIADAFPPAIHEPEVEGAVASPIQIDENLGLGSLMDNPSEELLSSDSLAAISLINTSGFETMLFDEEPLSAEDKQLLQDIEPGRNTAFDEFDVINQELGMTLNLNDVLSNLPSQGNEIDVLAPLNDAQAEEFTNDSMVTVESAAVINKAEFDDIMHQVESISMNTNLFE